MKQAQFPMNTFNLNPKYETIMMLIIALAPPLENYNQSMQIKLQLFAVSLLNSNEGRTSYRTFHSFKNLSSSYI